MNCGHREVTDGEIRMDKETIFWSVKFFSMTLMDQLRISEVATYRKKCEFITFNNIFHTLFGAASHHINQKGVHYFCCLYCMDKRTKIFRPAQTIFAPRTLVIPLLSTDRRHYMGVGLLTVMCMSIPFTNYSLTAANDWP